MNETFEKVTEHFRDFLFNSLKFEKYKYKEEDKYKIKLIFMKSIGKQTPRLCEIKFFPFLISGNSEEDLEGVSAELCDKYDKFELIYRFV